MIDGRICGATMRIIALIDDADVVYRMLKHLDFLSFNASLKRAAISDNCRIPYRDFDNTREVLSSGRAGHRRSECFMS